MIKQICKILWVQRRSNGWIFGELVIVLAFLWVLLDTLLVDIYTYQTPLGFDTENVYQLKVDQVGETSAQYIPEEERTSTVAEDIIRLMDRIRLHPDVEEVGVAIYSTPYLMGEMQSFIEVADGDTTKRASSLAKMFPVTSGYFDVFRIKNAEGKPIEVHPGMYHNPVILSADLEKQFFEGASGKGRLIKSGNSDPYTIIDISTPVRPIDYELPVLSYFVILSPDDLNNYLTYMGIPVMQLSVRMKSNKYGASLEPFLEEMGDRLIVNNLYVYGAEDFSYLRKKGLEAYEQPAKSKVALMIFVLINVLFGIIGTFWLRTQSQRNEIGLRLALGSSKRGLFNYMNLEGFCLLLLTFIPLLIFAGNVLLFDLLDSNRLPLSVGRFVITFGAAYLLVAGMICLGISLPARNASKIPPAEALKYE